VLRKITRKASYVNAQLGMLHQQLDGFGKWYLQMAIFFNPDFRKGRDLDGTKE